MRTAAVIIIAAGLSGLFSACDPCAGLSACGSMPAHLVMDGQLVRAENGRGVDGIAVDVIRRGGVELATDSLRVTTTDGGFFHVDVRALQPGDVILDFQVNTPELPHPYIVSQRVTTVDRSGESFVLDRWVVNPYLLDYASIISPSSGAPLPNTTVKLIRRGTVWLTGAPVRDSVATIVSDRTGLARLLASVTDTGDVVGDLVIEAPVPDGVITVPGVSLRPWYVYHALGDQVAFGKPMLDYFIQVYDRGSLHILSGIPFECRRTSGVAVQQDNISGTTDQNGYLHLPYVPKENGTMFADLTLHPTHGDSEVFKLTMPTYQAKQGRLLTNLTIGPAYPYYVVLQDSTGTPLYGVAVRFQQTGGVNVTPTDRTVYTAAGGRAWITPAPEDTGTSVFTLTVTPSPPWPSFKVTNFSLRTVQQDLPDGIQAWVFDLSRPLTAPPGAQVSPYP
jgi:hypothetical protein